MNRTRNHGGEQRVADGLTRGSAAPINWPAAVMFGVTTAAMLTVFPWYLWTHQVSWLAWLCGALLMGASGMSITGGYHRLWAHRAYEARWPVRVLFMLFGSMALQNSILNWASQHRIHHRNVDDIDQDPYSIKRGFWFAHMGWMLRKYPSGALDFSNARDLKADVIVMFQHRHYLALALGMNFGLPALLGWACGDLWGFLLIAGLLRLVLSHHVTFFINSLAHSWGRRPYTADNTARDNDVVSLLTYGEGYHNYHHLFQWDYRNGVRWWQYDPTKWLIAGLAWLGLTRNLKRVPEFKIQRALLQRQFERAQMQLKRCVLPERLAALQALLEHELETFSATLNEWKRLQTLRFEAARQQLAVQIEQSGARQSLRALEQALRQQRRRLHYLQLQVI